MINQFKNSETRESAVIYAATLEQIKMLYEKDKMQAGELAISAIELVLTGEISSDDFMIDLILKNLQVVAEKNKIKYEKKVTTQKQKRFEDLQLEAIAEMLNNGATQQIVADTLGESKQTISYRVRIIRA